MYDAFLRRILSIPLSRTSEVCARLRLTTKGLSIYIDLELYLQKRPRSLIRVGHEV
jgi:hypothetical protein